MGQVKALITDLNQIREIIAYSFQIIDDETDLRNHAVKVWMDMGFTESAYALTVVLDLNGEAKNAQGIHILPEDVSDLEFRLGDAITVAMRDNFKTIYIHSL